MEQEYVDGVNEIYKKDMLSNVHRLIDERLNEREKMAVNLYFFGSGKNSYHLLSKTFGVTRERVRQIIAKALKKLGHPSCKLSHELKNCYKEIA